MSEISDLFKQLITMGARFDALAQQVDRMGDRQIKLLQRRSTLEEKINTVNESARSAANAGVSELKSRLTERIVRLEMGGQARSLPQGEPQPPDQPEQAT